MPLTLRTDGTGAAELVVAQWWNDYYSLLTGAMADQIVTLKTDLVLKALGAPAAAPTVVAVAGTTMAVGSYWYAVTFVDANGGETLLTNAGGPATTTTNNQAVAVSNIAIGPSGTVQRNLYRTLVGGGLVYHLIAALGDNTTTTFNDIYNDTAISGNRVGPVNSSFGGTLTIKDGSGTTTALLYSNGAATFAGTLSIGGGVSVGYVNVGGSAYTTVFTALDTNAAHSEGYTFQVQAAGTPINAFSIGTGNPGAARAYVDNNGNYYGAGVPSNRNGTAGTARVFTGTSTPSGPNVGDIWIKA